jgi:hypothetical protein
LNHCGWLTYSPIQAERSAGVIWSPGHPSGYQRTLALMIPTNEIGYFECRIVALLKAIQAMLDTPERHNQTINRGQER